MADGERETISLKALLEQGKISRTGSGGVPGISEKNTDAILYNGDRVRVSPADVSFKLDEITNSFYPSRPLDCIVIDGFYHIGLAGIRVVIGRGTHRRYLIHPGRSLPERKVITIIEYSTIEDNSQS